MAEALRDAGARMVLVAESERVLARTEEGYLPLRGELNGWEPDPGVCRSVAEFIRSLQVDVVSLQTRSLSPNDLHIVKDDCQGIQPGLNHSVGRADNLRMGTSPERWPTSSDGCA
ncbi:MAG: hypothetical protein L0387_28985 [Acidobacteria bacterium]|nr:hypothetical protein [Acidobacteriota bacterium]